MSHLVMETSSASKHQLSQQGLESLESDLSPIFKNAMVDMIAEGVHMQANWMRLKWLSKRFQHEANSVSGYVTEGNVRAIVSESSSTTTNLAPNIPQLLLEPSPPTLTPAGTRSTVPSAGASSQELALLRKLSDAAILSLKRKDADYMSEVFDRHAKPHGLSTKALASALHTINPSAFPAQIPESNAARMLKEADTSNKGYFNFEEFCQTAKISSVESAGSSTTIDVFHRFADIRGLSADALMDALKEVDAPVLLSIEGCSRSKAKKKIFRQSDTKIRGLVDFSELVQPLFLPFFLVLPIALFSDSCAQLSCPMT